MIREAIKREIYAQHLNQAKLCRQLGLTKQSFNSFMNGRRSYPLRDIEKILKFLKLELLKFDD